MARSGAWCNNLATANSVWGICDDAHDNNHPGRLLKFVQHSKQEVCLLEQSLGQSTNFTTHVANAIGKIKGNVSVNKDEIIATSSTSSEALFVAILACAIRVMLMTECRTPESPLGSRNNYEWRGEETLRDFVERVYGQKPINAALEDHIINISDLRCCVLSAYAGLEIQSTDKLSDHLCLTYGGDYKILRIFSHRGFLDQSLEHLQSDREDLGQSTEEALALGCLPPQLLIETLRTLILLFPPLGDSWSKHFLKDWVRRKELDENLLKMPHRSIAPYASIEPPTTLLELQDQYPYWAQRLFQLLKEVDHPTPLSRWERHVDRMKSPRNMYKCALAALIVAAVSGTLATMLAAVQLWVAYCDWKNKSS